MCLNRVTNLFELDGPHRILPMEGLRGFAVLLVFLVHISIPTRHWFTSNSAAHPLLDAGWSIGHVGVDLFFVLSGFLIYGAVMKRQVRYATFMRRRIRRIYPTFLVILGIYVAMSTLIPSVEQLPQGWQVVPYLVANVLLLPGIFDIEPRVTVAWSLSFEMLYYLLIPAVVAGFRLRRRRARSRVLLFIGVLCVILSLAPVLGPTRMRMMFFVVGILVWEARRALVGRALPQWAEWSVMATTVLAIATSGAIQGPPPPHDGPSMAADVVRCLILAAAFGCLAHVAFQAKGILHRMLSFAPLRWLGNMSYSYYLAHNLAIKLMTMIVAVILPGAHSTAVNVALVAATFVATLVVSAVVYLAVERPLSLTTPHRVIDLRDPLPSLAMGSRATVAVSRRSLTRLPG